MSNHLISAQSNKSTLLNLLVLTVLLLIVMPAGLDVFRLNLVGKYLSYAFVAIGLVMCWGYCGILSLGQGIFFGLGGYCMAMFLKLEASSPEATAIQTTPGIPDFMDWNQITELPLFWEPFKSFPLTMIFMIAVPTLFAYLLGVALFKRRVGGVYFSIITQAIASILTILIIGQQGYTGGVNGITDLRTCLGFDIRTDHAKAILYNLCAITLIVTVYVTSLLAKSKLGRLLVAIRDEEERVRFSGYDVANFKIFIFCFSAALSAIGGALFTLQVGFMSPSFVGIVASIELVIFCAVGGRLSIFGAIYGTLLVSSAKTAVSENFPELWLFAMGALFIGVVLFFPNGLSGIYNDYIVPFLKLVDSKIEGSIERLRADHNRVIEELRNSSMTDSFMSVSRQFLSEDSLRKLAVINAAKEKSHE
ncbi:urea ABC transporter permease subunit UrtC [Succinivibrio sp.]|uniref:urea ABC transporter permease subunit UrtC n=1 Tax=Succinivibrio sp. TaxID=2053619 RepID=UPI0025E05BCE|nr:urea ABC transporter permease subunit UrtC [Succinivibrio sp.]MBQ9221105.1 urea ABC transporter permease subunit UrtC [Succinivibrio sp.]